MKRAWMWMLIGVLTLGVSAATTVRADATSDKDAGPKWTEDYKAAVAQAKKEKKMIFLDFTGSDWCHFCIELHKKVFSTPEFAKWSKQFVLVEVDFPHSKTLPADVKQQNHTLQKKYEIQGFPTIIILDANEKTLSTSVGYEGDAPKDWIAGRDTEIAKAQGK